MAYVQFYDSLPSGFRLLNLFVRPAKSIALADSITPNFASFGIQTSQGYVPVTYYGPALNLNQGSVSAITFGSDTRPWIFYGIASETTALFEYANGLAHFQASGAAAAATVMAGADSIRGSSNGDYLEGYAGNDILNGSRGQDTMVGGSGGDLYYVDNMQDRVIEFHRSGRDTVVASVDYILPASMEIEVLRAASGTKELSLTGNGASNHIIGNNGANTLAGGGGRDTLEGGSGSDVYLVNDSRTVIVEGHRKGRDAVMARVDYALTEGSSIEDLLADGNRNIDLTGNGAGNRITGNDADNVLRGGGGNDTLYAGAGRDVLRGGSGKDVLYGGKGRDVLYGDDDNDILYAGPEGSRMFGGFGDDVLNGYWNDDLLNGGYGNDRLKGQTGNDTLSGGPGNDTLVSGEGYDRFVFDAPLNSRTNVDTLEDFNPWADQIRLDSSIFSRLGKKGLLSADKFWIGSKAHEQSDRIIYDKAKGALYYDPDGTGSVQQVKFAIVGKLDLSAAAFLVI